MNKDKNSEKTDADILQCRADILRARDAISPCDKNTNHPANPPKVREDAVSVPIETAEHKAAKPPVVTAVNHKPAITRGELVEPTNQRKEHEIPKFDLAEEIMAEQRRITAVKRKAPTKKIETVNPPSTIGSAGLSQWPKPLEEGQIIAEIVARDIEELCHGDMRDILRQDFDTTKGAEQNTPPRP